MLLLSKDPLSSCYREKQGWRLRRCKLLLLHSLSLMELHPFSLDANLAQREMVEQSTHQAAHKTHHGLPTCGLSKGGGIRRASENANAPV